MKRTWIQLAVPSGPHKAGAVIEVEEATARAYVDAGQARYRPDAQPALDAIAAAEIKKLTSPDALRGLVRQVLDESLGSRL